MTSQSNEWSAGGRFLTKDYLDLGYVPCVLITAFTVCVVFEKTSVHQEIFLQSFQNYIAVDEEDVVAELVKGNFDANELIDVLNSFGQRKLLTKKKKVRDLILEVTHHEISEKPQFMAYDAA